ncbi:MAG: HEPN domain-containing protein [Candidatus Eremiobacteraeota bacterium]|nr:HEPN domain-containing protein [Candidatus Eremiobacteraeota bacterium]
MKSGIQQLIIKAERSLDAARALFDRGDYDFASSRAYFSTFYMAAACHLSAGRSYSQHSGVISGFNQHFVKTGIITPASFRILRNAFNYRNIGDYEILASLSHGPVEKLIRDAEYFLEETRRHLTSC